MWGIDTKEKQHNDNIGSSHGKCMPMFKPL